MTRTDCLLQNLTSKPTSDANTLGNPHPKWHFTDEHGAAYTITVASSRAERERAYRLAHRVYQTRGYVPDGDGMIVSSHDASAGTFTLLAEDATGRGAATITLVFDSSRAGLPCDEIYADALDALRADGCMLSEVTRLAIDQDHAHSRALLVNLFILCSVFARRVMRYSDFVIEVNPRHATFYRRMLSFEPAGPERPCPRVQDAPAVLLRLELAQQEREIGQLAGSCTGRSLYAYFCTLAEEPEIALFLDRSHRPMATQDVRYFKLEMPAVTVGPLGILV